MNMEQNVLIFKALSDETRFKIIMMLKDKTHCACMLLEKLSITQPTLSHHMDILCECGLVIPTKEGKWVYYRINNEIVEGANQFLSEIIKTGE